MLENMSEWIGGEWRRLKRFPRVGRVSLGDFHRLTPIDDDRCTFRGLAIDQYYIERFLSQHGADIRGRVLEVGDGEYARQYGGALSALETRTAGDLAWLEDLPECSFDCLILPQCLQLNYELTAGIQCIHRILRTGGTVLATFPGINRTTEAVQEEDRYWGLTTQSAQKLLSGTFETEYISLMSYGNVLTATAFLHGLAADELAPHELDHIDREYQVVVGARARKT